VRRALLLLPAVLLAGCVRQLLYFPEREPLTQATERARRLGLAPWRDPAGQLVGWREASPPPGPRVRLLVLHGNAGSALDRPYFRQAFPARHGPLPVEVLHLEYPGYGPRPGEPTQEALLAACRAAVADLRREPGPVVLVGESLGTAVAALCAAAAPAEVDGLLLVTPLASVPAVARRHYGLAPSFLVPDPWRADEALPRYGGPVGFLVAGRDEVVFADLGLALHAAYPGRKRLWLQPEATHNTVRYDPADPLWQEALDLLLGAA
jgi:pimeloyl-ACP methyl ester carboxylesterase